MTDDAYSTTEPKRFVESLLTRNTSYAGVSSDFEDVRSISWVNALTGRKLRNWRYYVSNHMQATTSLTAFRCSVVNDPISTYVGWNIPALELFGASQQFSGCLFTPVPEDFRSQAELDTIQTSVAENAAISKLFNQISKIESAVKSGEDFGEMAQTFRGLRQPLSGLKELFTKAANTLLRVGPPKRNLSPVKLRAYIDDLLRIASDTNLELAFGWNPLARDIGSALAGVTSDRSGFLYQKVKAIGYDNQQNIFTEFPNQYGTPFKLGYTKRIEVICRVVYLGEISVGNFGAVDPDSIDSRLGFMPQDFVPTLYNLLPYSFVADYVSNLGDIVKSSSVMWSSVAWMGHTTQKIYRVTYTPTSFTNALPGFYEPTGMSLNGGQMVEESVVTVRSPQIGQPIPTFQFQLPGSPVSAATNLVSLVFSKATKLRGMVATILGHRLNP